jgi:hypothetical protein
MFENERRSGAYSGRHRRARLARRARRLSGRQRVREDQQPTDADAATDGDEQASAEAEDWLGPDEPRPLPEYVFAGLALTLRPENPGLGA